MEEKMPREIKAHWLELTHQPKATVTCMLDTFYMALTINVIKPNLISNVLKSNHLRIFRRRKEEKKTIRKTTYKLEFNKIMEGEEYSASPPPPPAATKIESLACPEVLQNPRKKKKNKRRFSEEQIRSLESMFESETKLEPRKKVQLARELGLQPRQIAIWFQNRRARWKSKQIEQNYRVLKANYDSLLSRFESLKKEKQSLLKQLKMLGDLLEKTHDQGSKSKDLGGNSTSGDSDSGEPSCLKKGSDRGAVADSDGDEGGSGKNIQQEATENMGGQVDGSLALPEKSCNFESSSLFDGNSTWWDFWT
ncbi:homeobox-leucine zipper protein ATHB-12-like [Camellia sinensis]|uniref:Homeobox-leucine zipper protein n=1 Tax=Camellia sinensis var. sinensis TaxID=542762 RepID=A0A4S4EVK2_CAMSN|nr:homeobox-leucine zipper protein ATHB-12-like [Camellia sinensis]THG21000.1 hypothetical protein TEA_029876 [Camellia sinensis var. sinensis]